MLAQARSRIDKARITPAIGCPTALEILVEQMLFREVIAFMGYHVGCASIWVQSIISLDDLQMLRNRLALLNILRRIPISTSTAYSLTA